MNGKCRHCGSPGHDTSKHKHSDYKNTVINDPGDYYAAKTREAAAWQHLLTEAKAQDFPAEVIKRIQYHLEMARYVGD